MQLPRWTVLATAGAALLALPACGNGSPAEAEAGGRLSVVTAFYPLEFVADRIGGDHITAGNLTQPGAEPHDLELTPKQVGEVAGADLVVYVKGFQPAVDEAVEQNPPEKTVEVSTVTPFETTGAEDALEEPEHGDPHLWLDPTKLAKVATAVGDQLAELDPDSAGPYRANAEALVKELGALDEAYRAGLATCRQKDFVTSHAAFGYLAKRYGLEQVPIAGFSPEAEPSAQRIAEVQRLVRDKGVTTVFFETLVSPKLSETIARDTGTQTAVLDPIEGIENGSSDDYFSVMRANLEALRKALSCT